MPAFRESVETSHQARGLPFQTYQKRRHDDIPAFNEQLIAALGR